MQVTRRSLLAVLLATVWAFAATTSAAPATRPATEPVVNVILWFDTEDYLLPACDDATKRLCEILSDRSIRGTFKIVGEKARVMEKRGRTDVTAALKKHDIGYHTDFHSVHPTPTEYLADCNLLDGMAEFVRREANGAADVRRILGVPTLSCYGQPGSSWGPQAVAALKEIGVAPNGVACYVDEGNHVGKFGGKPFWYCNALVVYDMKPNRTRMDLHATGAVEPGCKEFDEIANRLRKEGGGLISIYYHPSEWVHKEFWDGVNFRRGRNPPREEWVAPPQRTAEETSAAYERFAAYVDHMRKTTNVKFVVASDLPAMYPDKLKSAGASYETRIKLADRIAENSRAGKGIDYLTVDGLTFSPADQFELLTATAFPKPGDKPTDAQLRPKGLLGPDGPGPEKNPIEADTIPFAALRDASADVRDFVTKHGRVPARVFIGPEAISPTDYLATLANWYGADQRSDKSKPDQAVKLMKDIPLATVRHIAADTPNLFGGWVIHKANFRAPHLMEVARWQAWTLKPAE